MDSGDVMIAIVFAGIGLSGLSFRSRYIDWRDHKATEVRKQNEIACQYARPGGSVADTSNTSSTLIRQHPSPRSQAR